MMTRKEFMWGLRTTDEVFDDEPLSLYAQQIADYDADRRELIKDQRALIEQQAGVIAKQQNYITQLKQTISVYQQAGMEGLMRDYNDHQRIEQQAKEIARLRKFASTFLERMNKYGQWEDGCFYHNRTCASELKEVIDMAKQALKEEHP
jgi:shikimate kinase